MTKVSLPLSLLLSGLTGGGSAYLVASAMSESPASDARAASAMIEPEVRPARAAAEVAPESEWRTRAELIETTFVDRLDELEARFNLLAAAPSDDLRSPVLIPDEVAEITEQTQAALETEEARLLVLDIVEQDRVRREEERRAEREERRRTELDKRVDRLAEKLGLSDYDRGQLADVLTTESDKRNALFEAMRSDDGPMDRGAMRDSMREIRDWKDSELETRFGSDLAAEIDEADDWRGGRGGGPGGGGNNGGNNGGNAGGRRGGGGNGGGRGGGR